MRLLKILLIAMLVVLPFGEIFRFGLGNDIYFKPLDALSILLLCWTMILYIRNKKWRTSLKWYYFLFPLIGLISLLINSFWLRPTEILVSFLYLIRWVGYMSVFFGVIQTDEKLKNKIRWFMLADGIVILVIGFLQFFLYPNLRNLVYLGWDEHLYRLFSSFLDPNFAGAFLVLFLLFVMSLFFQKKQTKKRLILLGILEAVTLVAIFLTYSRSALLMLLVSGITFFLLMQKKKFILLLVGLLVAFVLIISPYFYLENINLFRINSSIARLTTSENALRVIQDHPIIGVGFDSYRYAQEKYTFYKFPQKFPDHSDAGVDMSLLFVFATTGIIGLAAYLYLWFRLLKTARQSYKNEKNMYGIMALACEAGLFIDALFLNSLFYPTIMLWMWLIFSFNYKKEKN